MLQRNEMAYSPFPYCWRRGRWGPALHQAMGSRPRCRWAKDRQQHTSHTAFLDLQINQVLFQLPFLGFSVPLYCCTLTLN